MKLIAVPPINSELWVLMTISKNLIFMRIKKENGFAVIRVTYENMNEYNISTVLQKNQKIDLEQLKPLEGLLTK
jgi:hypothetical protein